MTDKPTQRELSDENAALREQNLQLEQRLANEQFKKQRARSRDLIILAIFLFMIAFVADHFVIPFQGKPAGAEKAAMIFGSLGGVLLVAGILSAFRRPS